MYKNIRQAIAASVKEVKAPDTTQWTRWLKAPKLEQRTIGIPASKLPSVEKMNNWIITPENFSKAFTINSVSISDQSKYIGGKYKIKIISKQADIPREKTNPVLFGFGSVKHREIKLIDKTEFKIIHSVEIVFENNESYFNVKSYSQNQKSIKFKVTSEEKRFLIPHAKIIELKAIPEKPIVRSILFDFNPVSIIDMESDWKNAIPIEINFHVPLPDISSDLTKIFPEIFNIDLLQTNDLVLSQKVEDLKNILFTPLNSFPKIFNVNILSLTEIKVSTYTLKKIDLEKVKISGYTTYNFSKSIVNEINSDFTDTELRINYIFNENSDEELSLDSYSETDRNKDLIGILLQPSLKSYKITDLENILLPYQKEGSNFLSEYSYAGLFDEFGLGKTIQLLAAIINLSQQNRIKKLLIVAPTYDLGKTKLSENSDFNEGWEGTFYKYAAGIDFSVVKGNDEERALLWRKPSSITITDYKSLFIDISENNIEKRKLAEFNFIIFDEVQNLNNEKTISQQMLFTINPTYLWITSGYYDKNLFNEIFREFILDKSKKLFSNSLNVLRRTINDVVAQTPLIRRKNYWVELSENEMNEYSVKVSEVKNQITEFLSSGNPFRLQANIYSSIHQLKQFTNFSGDKSFSAKSNLLLEQIKTIKNNKRRLIVFSQYDKQGTQKLETVFSENNIKYSKYLAGMSASEIENEYNKFAKDESITVFLAGVKAAGTKISLPNVSYIIYFDQWWNPIPYWAMEDKLAETNYLTKKENMTIINYLTRGTVDEKIFNTFTEKGLLKKKITDTIPSEVFSELISDEDWLELLGVYEENTKRTKKNLEIIQSFQNINESEFSGLLTRFFNRLGYKISINKIEENDYELEGSAYYSGRDIKIIAKCFNRKVVTYLQLKSFIDDQSSREIDKVFIITTGIFEEDAYISKNGNLIYIDGNLLINYLIQFRIK